jgi:hypothetical protein
VQGSPNCDFGGALEDGLYLLLSDAPEDGPQWISLLMRRGHMSQTAQRVQDLEEQLAAAPTNLANPASAVHHDQAGEAQNDIQELEQRLKDAKRIAGAWDTLKMIEQHYNSTGNQFDNEQSQQLWNCLPLDMQDMVKQGTRSWFALRERYLFTGSSAFYLLLCGTGGRQQFNWVLQYRRGMPPMLCLGSLLLH